MFEEPAMSFQRLNGPFHLAAAGLLLALCAFPALAGPDIRSIAVQQNEKRSEYDRIAQEIRLSDQRSASLAAEIATVRKDHETLTAALIASAEKERALGTEIEAIVARLDPLKQQENTIRRSLAERRGVLAEVLGALQRMGLNPPPAILVEPEDALASVRSAILLGAVVPGLRGETDKLVADLGALASVSNEIEAERAKLAAAASGQATEKRRLEMLIGEKQRLAIENEASLREEQRRAEQLAARAGSLKELIAGLEKDASKADALAEKERRAAEAKAARNIELAALPVPEANRLAGAIPFSTLKQQIALPVGGRIERRFGSNDGNGAVMLGDMVATQSGAIVTAPADGSVLYAGPFRSYGQLLILNAGDGYHVVLAGMDRINVTQGQSVLAGEPVGAMGETRVASIAALEQDSGPELYVEFRKDGRPVDPAPWWADRSGRTGNGT